MFGLEPELPTKMPFIDSIFRLPSKAEARCLNAIDSGFLASLFLLSTWWTACMHSDTENRRSPQSINQSGCNRSKARRGLDLRTQRCCCILTCAYASCSGPIVSSTLWYRSCGGDFYSEMPTHFIWHNGFVSSCNRSKPPQIERRGSGGVSSNN